MRYFKRAADARSYALHYSRRDGKRRRVWCADDGRFFVAPSDVPRKPGYVFAFATD